MGWHNGGDWTGIDGTEIPIVLAELCNAVNERRDCLGLSRISWVVNTGTKSTNLADTDFYGMDLFKHDHMQDVFNEIITLVTQSGIQSTTHCAGFAKTNSNTGVGTDLWTAASIETDSGFTAINPVRHALDKAAADYLRAALDRLIYPVVWPTNYLDLKDQDIGSGTRTYWHSGDDGGGATPGSASAAYADLAVSSINGIHTQVYDAYLAMQIAANFPGAGFGYRARALTKTILEVAPRSGGYLGTIAKAIATVYADYNDVGSAVDFSVMGATLSVSGDSPGTGEPDKVDVTVSGSNFSLSGATNPEITCTIPVGNPFDGVSGTGNPDPAEDIGLASATLICKYDIDGITSTTNTGTLFTRLILDITGELSDQA